VELEANVCVGRVNWCSNEVIYGENSRYGEFEKLFDEKLNMIFKKSTSNFTGKSALPINLM
jgi:hypothetical protein